MGWSSSWVAIQGCAKDELLEHLGLVETGQDVLPGTRSAPFSCARLPEDWFVLFSEDFDWAQPRRVLELSRFGLAVGCQFEDKVMMESSICAARDGVELWRVFHDHEGSVYRLDLTGEPPAELAAIRDRLFQEQAKAGGEDAGVDYVHEAPFELGRAICGYRHDEDESAFVGLKRAGGVEPAVTPPRLSLLDKLLAPFRARVGDQE